MTVRDARIEGIGSRIIDHRVASIDSNIARIGARIESSVAYVAYVRASIHLGIEVM